jgi:hypothetical protein
VQGIKPLAAALKKIIYLHGLQLTHPDISASRRIVDPLFSFAGKRVKKLVLICHAERLKHLLNVMHIHE